MERDYRKRAQDAYIKRNAQISILVSKEVKARIQKNAKAEGLSMKEFIVRNGRKTAKPGNISERSEEISAPYGGAFSMPFVLSSLSQIL